MYVWLRDNLKYPGFNQMTADVVALIKLQLDHKILMLNTVECRLFLLQGPPGGE